MKNSWGWRGEKYTTRRRKLGKSRESILDLKICTITTMSKNGALNIKETGSINLFCVVIFLSLMILACSRLSVSGQDDGKSGSATSRVWD